jgi:hypothetical protein
MKLLNFLSILLCTTTSYFSLPTQEPANVVEKFKTGMVPIFKPSKYLPSLFPAHTIQYNMGAPVLTNDVQLYYIFYGNWTVTQKANLKEFGQSLGNNPWWTTMREYYFQANETSPKIYVNGNLKFVKSVEDNYSRGTSLKGNDIPDIIREQTDSGALPKDSSAVYLVLISGDVQEEIKLGGFRFCREYCGYHVTDNFTSGERFYYAMVGSPSRCMNVCVGLNNRKSANNDPPTDAMMSAIAHEIAEVVSDPEDDTPELRAWNSDQGHENGKFFF